MNPKVTYINPWRKPIIAAICLLVFFAVIGFLRIVPVENKQEAIPASILGPPVDFNADIRPIINKKCIACHGGVKKSGGFSLLFEEEALAVNESGLRAIVPGNTWKSELLNRITHHDPEVRMPLDADPLTDEEVRLFRRWINQGAPWKDHWAYIPPKKQEVPNVDSEWVSNDIDKFVLQRMTEEGLSPNPRADKYSLIRRVSLDLTGLPPTLEQVAAFVEDDSADAYENLVDELLSSPAYGERWAAMWMDLARYADSKGYEADRPRSIWKYRDWLIKAFNTNMSFDQFVAEQLAGDLFPKPDDPNYIATAFHRNTMNNDEGGTDNEEFRNAALIDRVNTTWSVLQGTTMECVQCHSHPYDPIRHEDFFKSMAFFNQSADADIPSESPVLVDFEDEEDQSALERIQEWVRGHCGGNAEHNPRYYRQLIRITEPKLHPHFFEQMEKGLAIPGTSVFKVSDSVYSRRKEVPFTGENRLMLRYQADTSVGVMQIRVDAKDGEIIGSFPVNQKTKKVFDNEEKKDKIYTIRETLSVPIKPMFGKRDLYFVLEGADKAHTECFIEWVVLHQALPGEGQKGYDKVEKDFHDIFNTDKKRTTTPIMVDLKDGYRRKTRVFEKGNWMVLGEEVKPGVPEKWNSFKNDWPQDRLGLAQWIISHKNPLTARVTVNRFWEQLFGLGIVETLEDFGSQGIPPTHPELLDWMALRFIHHHNWDVKALLKELVSSSTYQQSSIMRDDHKEVDPRNKLLARGPRVRLNSEQVRDQALAVSGLLSGKMFGPSVMPVQPEGIWQVVYSGGFSWKTSQGEDRNRRALYTFWRRTSPYPSFISFDAPSREFCLPRRINTNTPLQALVTLNDPVYLEAAQALARKVLKDKGSEKVDQKIKLMYSLTMLRGIQEDKMEDLLKLYQQTSVYFDNDPEAICQFTGEESKELALWTVMANAMMNLDEFVMKS
ncbi:DUF1553 domain-containing protein [Pleomorphovibrio marinus]|uniref:DUF1553 domain-containing protein n=1 Tax=Pleomorphovibrio marinus TaxID=2164132 RepID=UPI000E0B482B|nr:DUF1553 domain-containing protein [Pleomorphovibrio marinus]